MFTVVFGAGGTGGHVFPAIAVADELKRRHPEAEIVFIGLGNELERRFLNQAGYRHEAIPFVPITGGGIKGLIRFACKLPGAWLKGIRLYRNIRPSFVIGFGGYPAFIPVLTAWTLRIPRALHEQNVQVGLANKLLSLLVPLVFAVPRANGFFSGKRIKHLTNPVRRSVSEVPAWEKPKGTAPWVIFVMGGSQGAVSLNDAIIELLPHLAEQNIYLIHQTGARDFERVQKAHLDAGMKGEVHAFIDDITELYSKAHLIICRAGAMTAAEVSSAGRPAIYVPLKIAGGHQKQNIEHLVELGAARVEEHGEGLAKRLLGHIEELFETPSMLDEMAARAKTTTLQDGRTSAEQITETIFNLARPK